MENKEPKNKSCTWTENPRQQISWPLAHGRKTATPDDLGGGENHTRAGNRLPLDEDRNCCTGDEIKKIDQAAEAGSSDPVRGKKRDSAPGRPCRDGKETEFLRPKMRTKEEKRRHHTSCKNQNFPLTSTRFTTDPRRSPPSLPPSL
jgi:hypothetical protein